MVVKALLLIGSMPFFAGTNFLGALCALGGNETVLDWSSCCECRFYVWLFGEGVVDVD